jgi:hypothetical protein
MNTIWNEAAIRREFARLDAKTGLKGAKLPITFGNAKGTLGSYTSANGGAFRFSRHYFNDASWPVEEALDTIRHEYAHYMDHMVYGNMGHGASWKKCCLEVGALPIRCYSRERAKYYQDKHEKEQQKSSVLDQYTTGCFIVHPKFGTGKIVEIVGTDHTRYAVVTFKNMENKKLSLTWVDENCRRCT